MRLSATKSITSRSDVIIVATVSAIYGLGDPDSYAGMVLELSVGQKIEQREIIQALVKMQYKRNNLSLDRATFRVHGDVIDVFPAENETNAIRIDLFDEEIESAKSLIDIISLYESEDYLVKESNKLKGFLSEFFN